MSDTSSLSGISTPESSTSSQRPHSGGGKSKFERDVEAALRKGRSECKNLQHWEVYEVPGGTPDRRWTDVRVRNHRDILTMMSPGKAQCSCEKKACRWAWTGNWNYKGMFQTQYIPAGMEQKGIGEVQGGFLPRRMFPLPYGLNPAQFKCLSDRFPEWYFICDASGSHDHPVAHTSTKLAARRLMDSLPRGTAEHPKIYIDLHGNPTANEAYMARNPGIEIMTFVELITPKDYVRRSTKWGPQERLDGSFRYYDTHIRDIPAEWWDIGHCIDGILSFHTTYYYDAVEVANLLAWAPNANYYAMMHRFDGTSGFLNNKEQEWAKTPSSFGLRVTQTNVVTGEQYEHPDNAWWFENDSWCNDDVGFGWTTGMLCGETYMVTATGCTPTACKMSPSCKQVRPTLKVLKHSTASAISGRQIAEDNRVVVELYGARFEMDIHPRLVPFFEEMRATVIHKPRTAANFADHVSRLKIRAKSVMSSQSVLIDAQQMSDIARATFFIDFQDQYGFDKAMFDKAYFATLQADPFYKSGSGALSVGTLSMLTDMLMGMADAKDFKTAVIKGARSGVQHLNRAKVLRTN